MVIRIERKSHVATLSNFYEAVMEPQHCVFCVTSGCWLIQGSLYGVCMLPTVYYSGKTLIYWHPIN